MSRRLPQHLTAALATALVPLSLLTVSTAAAAPLDYLDTVTGQTSSLTTLLEDSNEFASALANTSVELAVGAVTVF